MSPTLADVTELIIDTKHNTPKFTEDGYPCIRTPNIGRGVFILDNVKRVSEETYREWIDRAEPRENDLVLAREAPVGNVAIIPRNLSLCIGQRTVLIRPIPEKVNPRYLCYLLLGDEMQAAMHSYSGGATVAHLNMSDIRKLSLPELPRMEVQLKIASILSTYDDLIENNTRRIRILEEMAQSLYREWFVNFRFPGHEKVKLINSSLGKIPEGWEVVKFTDVADVLSGGTPKTKEESYWGGSIPFFTPRDAVSSFYVTRTEKTITELGLSKCSSKLYPKNTVIITARGTVGKVVMPATEMAMNQSCYALVGKDGISQLYLFFLTLQATDLLKKNTGGATFDTIIVDTFKRLAVLKPETEPMSLFTQQVEPGFQAIRNLLYTNINLRRTRDHLLPKLISGEVNVDV